MTIIIFCLWASVGLFFWLRAWMEFAEYSNLRPGLFDLFLLMAFSPLMIIHNAWDKFTNAKR